MRITREFPTSGYVTNAGGRKVAEWRADLLQSIIHGRHPHGMDYRRLVNAPPALIEFSEINWPTGWVLSSKGKKITKQTKHTEEPSSVCASLYAEHPSPRANEFQPNGELNDVPQLADLHPELPTLYRDLIQRVHTPKAGERNKFIKVAVPFLLCAVSKRVGLLFVAEFYRQNTALFNDPLSQHLYEAESHWRNCGETFLAGLTERELNIYNRLPEPARDAFRIFRRLSQGENKGSPRGKLFLSCRKLGTRLAIGDKAAWHLRILLVEVGAVECTKKGTVHAPGAKGRAAEYRWLAS